MECIYIPNIDTNSISISIPREEATHLKALRVNSGETILATNGSGLMCELIIERKGKIEYFGKINNVIENYGENANSIALAIGLLADKSRFEFALEKAIELGISDFFPLSLDFSQKFSINYQRLESKAISAIKQCKRSKLPIIHKERTLSELALIFNQFSSIIYADPSGELPSGNAIGHRTLLIIGSEGGFSQEEIKLLESHKLTKWNLGNRRLRAETAAISALGFISLVSL